VWISHGTHLNESWHACEWVTAHIRMSHGTHVNESRHSCESFGWVFARCLSNWCQFLSQFLSHGTHVNESWHTFEWVMRMSHVIRVHAFLRAASWIGAKTYSCGSVLRHEWDEWVMKESLAHPPKNGVKNGVIALWPNTGVVKFKYYVSQQQNGFNNKIHWYGILPTSIFKFTARL